MSVYQAGDHVVVTTPLWVRADQSLPVTLIEKGPPAGAESFFTTWIVEAYEDLPVMKWFSDQDGRRFRVGEILFRGFYTPPTPKQLLTVEVP